MNDSSKAKAELIREVSALRKKIRELELCEAERKRMEEELVVSRNRLSKAEIISRCGNWEFNLGLNSVFGSEGARRIYGLQSGEWTIEEVQRIPLPEYRQMLDEALRGLIDRNGPYSVEFKIRRPDTGEVIDIYSVAEYDAPRKVVFGVVQDITERRRSEAEKARLESQLFRARKMEAIGALAGGIAHDFNNIFTVITGYGALMKMEMGESNPLNAYVDNIVSSAEKAAHLTQSLLSFSRQQPIALTRIDLNESLRSVGRLLGRLLTENIVIRTLLTAGDVTIMADATQVDQILLNLAANARDAMPEGGVLSIETSVVELDEEFRRRHGFGAPGRYALLSVSDTGMGLDESIREKIFDPFFTTKETGKGTGLGLSTVYGIVKQHNGFITVYSEPGMGTAFHIYLPTVGDKAHEEEEPAPLPSQGGRETILVAEDNDAVRDLICKVLTEYGYTIVEAADGEEAIERFKGADKIDLLILDSVMPKKGGREAYNGIHEIEPHIKVIFTSGYTRDVILDKGIEDRQFAFISKPISPGALLRKVREVLDE